MLFGMIILETVYQSCLNGLPICWTILFIFSKLYLSVLMDCPSFQQFIHLLIYSSSWAVCRSIQIINFIHLLERLVKSLQCVVDHSLTIILVIRTFFHSNGFLLLSVSPFTVLFKARCTPLTLSHFNPVTKNCDLGDKEES